MFNIIQFFKVDDAKNVQVAFEDQKITFSCDRTEILPDGKKSGQVKHYRNEIDLFGKLDVEVIFIFLSACRPMIKNFN